MTLHDFHQALTNFDWWYDQIDNHKMWKSHFDRHGKLLAIASLSDEHRQLYEQHLDHAKNGGPKPQIPEAI